MGIKTGLLRPIRRADGIKGCGPFLTTTTEGDSFVLKKVIDDEKVKIWERIASLEKEFFPTDFCLPNSFEPYDFTLWERNVHKIYSQHRKYLEQKVINVLMEIPNVSDSYKVYPYLKSHASVDSLMKKAKIERKCNLVENHFGELGKLHCAARNLNEPDLIHSDPNMGNRLIKTKSFNCTAESIWIDTDIPFSQDPDIEKRIRYTLKGAIINISQFFEHAKDLEMYLQSVISACGDSDILRKIVSNFYKDKTNTDFDNKYDSARKEKDLEWPIFTVHNFNRVFEKLNEMLSHSIK